MVMPSTTSPDKFKELIQLAIVIARRQVTPTTMFGFNPFFLFAQDRQVSCAVGLVDVSKGAMEQFVGAIRQLSITQQIRTGVLVAQVKCDEMYAPTITPNSVLKPPSDFIMLACQSKSDAPTFLLAVERDNYDNYLSLGRTTQAAPVSWLSNLVSAPEGLQLDDEIEKSSENVETMNGGASGITKVFVISKRRKVHVVNSPHSTPMPYDHHAATLEHILSMINAANLEYQEAGGIVQTSELCLTDLHEIPALTEDPSALASQGKQVEGRGRTVLFYHKRGLRKNGPLCTLAIHQKHIFLKSKGGYYQKGHHVAKILGPDAAADFERQILTRDDHGWPYYHSATVNEPGLYELRSFDQFGKLVDSYTVFDGQKNAEISREAARLLAPKLNNVELKPIVAQALVLNRQDLDQKKRRKKELCLWMLNCAQNMGQLEQRSHNDHMVCVRPELPIKVIPCHKPEWVGFTHPRLCGSRWGECAWKGTPAFDKLMASTLNKLPQSELEEIAKYLCHWLQEDQILRRVLAVVNHADPNALDNLQKVVDLTENFCPELYPVIVTTHYHRFLRLASAQGCLLHTSQVTRIL